MDFFLEEHWICSHVPPSLGEKKHSMYYLIIGLLITICGFMHVTYIVWPILCSPRICQEQTYHSFLGLLCVIHGVGTFQTSLWE